MKNKKELSLYIHIPFCKQKCFYCDFPSYASIDYLREDYVEALCKEINEKGTNYKIKSIFIGGGTPSYLDTKEIRKILEAINKLDLSEDMEFTMECNPGALEEEKLKTMLNGGVNRISMGLQAVQNSLLKDIGRIHSFKQFEENFKLARNVGFKNINVDLMFGLPNQKVEEWIESLECIAKLNPEHISAYSLIIEEGTPFGERKLKLPDEDTEYRMYENTAGILAEYGFHQYEISNYAKGGRECRHNKGYWQRIDYLGLGLGASSLLDHMRFSNTADMKEYIGNSAFPDKIRQNMESLTEADEMAEFMFLGLRMTEGVSMEAFAEYFGKNMENVYGEVLKKHLEIGMLEQKGDRIYLSRKGIHVSNGVMADFLL